MAELTTADTNFAGTVVTLVSREVQDTLRDSLRWMQPGAFKTAHLIKGTNQARYVAYGDLTVDDSLVSAEGSPNAATEFAIGYQTLTCSQRMRTVRLSDVAMDESPHDLYSIAAEKIGYNAAAVADYVASAAVMASTLSTTWPNGRANRAALTTGDNLTAAAVKAVVALLKKRNVPMFPDGSYHAMVDPNVVYDLQADTAVGGWIEASKYGAPGQLMNGEIGKIGGVRFIETNVGLEIDTTAGVGGCVQLLLHRLLRPRLLRLRRHPVGQVLPRPCGRGPRRPGGAGCPRFVEGHVRCRGPR